MKQKMATYRPTTARPRDRFIELIGAAVVQFQDGATAFDDVASQILALDRADLPCMTMLLFGGPASIDALAAALHLRRSTVVATTDRLQLAGYARRWPRDGAVLIELTEHAREWIRRIWEPLREDGGRLLATYSTRDLAMMRTFMARVCEIQDRHLRRLRDWLVLPSSSATKAHLRGGLSPAAMRRVQLFVEANLDRRIRLRDLAERAGLSLYHFARAFRTSAGVTPREFVEQRRIERASHLLSDPRGSLAAIAVECGFATQSRLTIAFKRQTGFTPAEYRRGRTRRTQFASTRTTKRAGLQVV
jgi:AraC family transcriptional regulator